MSLKNFYEDFQPDDEEEEEVATVGTLEMKASKGVDYWSIHELYIFTSAKKKNHSNISYCKL